MEDERTFVKWSANHFEYPLTIEQLAAYKKIHDENENRWIVTALDEKGSAIGHILMNKLNLDENSIHFGHVLVDPLRRGNGIGKEMLKTALIYAFEVFQVSKVTLSVFDNNVQAFHCYKSLGFKTYAAYTECFSYGNEKWGCYYMEVNRDEIILQ
jgi:RimJ/RimL family protein N-acetyltransferase